MKRSYEIDYYEKNKYGKKFSRTFKVVSLGKPTGKVEKDAKAALNIFIANCGSLKKNEITAIREYDEKGEQIGDTIYPMEGSSIVPVGR